jgi:hypothetical protein
MELNGGLSGAVLPGLPAVLCTELTSRYDSIFKTIISAGWAVASDGNVESSVGYFARVEIPADEGERDEMEKAVCDVWSDRKIFRELESGWYLTQEDNNGLIWVYWSNESHVTDAYGHLVEAYGEWESSDDQS